MSIAGNPKSLAMDIADGFTSLSPAALKRYAPADIKIIHSNLGLVLREIRGEVIPTEDLAAVKKKNLRIQRINQALLMLSNHARQQKVPL